MMIRIGFVLKHVRADSRISGTRLILMTAELNASHVIAAKKAGAHLAEVTYQTSGISWHAEYVLVLGKADKTADLSGWISVNNRSGKTYRRAKMKFIAGDVRKVRDRRAPVTGLERARSTAGQSARG